MKHFLFTKEVTDNEFLFTLCSCVVLSRTNLLFKLKLKLSLDSNYRKVRNWENFNERINIEVLFVDMLVVH